MSMDEQEEGRVERLVAGGLGLIRRNGPICLLAGVLPGELVRYRISETRKGVSRGERLSLLEPSSERVEPPCPYYERCGGCQLQEISYAEQLRVKEEILRDQLRRIGGIQDPPLSAVRHGDPYGYRSRVRLHPGEAEFGFRARRSNEVVPIERCLVADRAINEEIERLRAEGGVASSSAEESLLLTRVDEGVLRSGGGAVGQVTLLGHRVSLSGDGFFQSNLRLFEELLAELRDRVAPTAGYTLFDLYGGTGAVSAVIAREVIRLKGVSPGRVISVESDERSARLAEENLRGIPTELHRRPVEAYLRSAAPPSRGVVIVDPPRAGLSKEVRRWLQRGRPGQLFYVSCDPGTLARDLKALLSRYELREILPFDFFPQTPHIETLCLLEPRETPA